MEAAFLFQWGFRLAILRSAARPVVSCRSKTWREELGKLVNAHGFGVCSEFHAASVASGESVRCFAQYIFLGHTPPNASSRVTDAFHSFLYILLTGEAGGYGKRGKPSGTSLMVRVQAIA